MWAQKAGGNLGDVGQAIATDEDGNVYVTGYFRSSFINFGSITLFLSGDYNIFLVKYDPDGNVLWAKSSSSTSTSIAYNNSNGISITASGDIYIAGLFQSTTITFGSTTLTNSVNGTGDIFIAKYDATGNALWALKAGGLLEDGALSIANDNDGNAYVSGFFRSPSISFGSITLSNLGSAATSDLFILKCDGSGNAIWAHETGGSNDEFSNDIATDQNGHVYITGEYLSASISFGSITLNNVSTGKPDLFLTKFDAAGNVIWAKMAGGQNYDYGMGIAADTADNVFITGYFNFNATFDNLVLYSNANSEDVFIAKYDSSGSVLWVTNGSGSAADYSYKIALDAEGNAFITGGFSSDVVNFDTVSVINSYYNSSFNLYDVFVTKYGISGCNTVFYQDADGDGYGNPNVSEVACITPLGFVSDSNDCNDNYNGIHPGVTEVCNSVDDNCNGQIDEGVQLEFFADSDGDNYGNPEVFIFGCEVPSGYAGDSTDCNDQDANINPGAYDIPDNGIDEDCDGVDADMTSVPAINSEAGELSVFPNPADDMFFIEVKLSVPKNQGAEASIINTLGEIMRTVKFQVIDGLAKKEFLTDDKLSPGIYMLRVTMEDKIYSRQLIIKH